MSFTSAIHPPMPTSLFGPRVIASHFVLFSGGDVAIKLSYVLERCLNFDPDSSTSWFADTAASQDYSVLAKWGRMTGDFDEYTTRLSNSLNEIGKVSPSSRLLL